LTTARYGQLQPSTKTTVQVNNKKTDENIINVQYETYKVLATIIIIKFNSFIYVLDNSEIWPVTAKHKNNSTG
jgi:hypothetical protein